VSERDFVIPADTVASQMRAAHPDASAWVEANAGSGKTHVLTQRVLRLLLADVAPEAILCLTYTKAAAAEMRNRVSARLGDWAIASDEWLDERLKELGQTPTPALRARARTLFARALETPGGLKIVTIHAFCESVLHRFPLEAGVPFGFKVVEDVERAAMIAEAREAVLAGGLRGNTDASAPSPPSPLRGGNEGGGDSVDPPNDPHPQPLPSGGRGATGSAFPSPLVGEGARRADEGSAMPTPAPAFAAASQPPHPDFPLDAENLSLSHEGRGGTGPEDDTVDEEASPHPQPLPSRGRGVSAGAVETLFGLLSDFSIGEAIDFALAEGRRLKVVLADVTRAKANLRRLTGHSGRSVAAIEDDILAGRTIGPGEKAAIVAASPPGKAGFSARLAAVQLADVSVDGWLDIFFTQKNGMRADLTQRLAKADAGLATLVEQEAQRLAVLRNEHKTAVLVERSDALLDVLAAIVARYEAGKRRRAVLDFDDLIEKLASLLADSRYQLWVQYKLDAGIHHILVDESQDTNPEQWRVVAALTGEFFTGEGQVTRPRTLFSVGDPKQSIYSFQGAEPRLFIEAGRDYGRRARAADKPFEDIRLYTSFRTLRPILEAVDLVCARQDIQAALLAEQKVHHDTARTEVGGRVTLWPPVQQAKPVTPTGEWPLKPLETVEQTAPRQVATRIAREIRGWLDAGRRLANGRAMSADDVMVLVQSRSALFHEIIRALIAAGLPTPGADRLLVTGHIVVKDLLALADVLANTGEDLQLAAVLRSPLFDVCEDDLFAIAADRGRESLWQALAHTRVPSGEAAYTALAAWRSRLDFGRPYAFFAEVLYAWGGLRRFHARLGGEVDDVLAEFLELALKHEQDAQPSLTGFVAAMRRQEVSIKRDLAERGGGVRVMTVHGAKGLEAPIVILADAATKPNGRQTAKPVLVVTQAPGPLLVHASARDDHVEATLKLREESEKTLGQEYWRRLYVAMTRAEEALYVTGSLTPGTEAATQLKGTWYEAMETALRPHAHAEADADGNEIALVYPAAAPEPGLAGLPEGAAGARPAPVILASLPEPSERPVVRPSSAYEARHALPVLDTAAESLRDAEEARRTGIALHALLQHLPRVPAAQWLTVAEKAAAMLLPEHPDAAPGLAQRAISILSRPELAHLFRPESRAEVPFLLDARRGGKPVRLAGRIDRLVVDERRVLVVDYKSDATRPGAPESVPQTYLTQLGLYALVAGQLFPDRTVEAAILWTSMESLMNLPRDLLAARTTDFTLG
jgi:ATP-dependent helicase/nuclease subunit A